MEVPPMCINGNKAVNICTSDHCVHPNPFICDSCVNNQCYQLHGDCITSQWKKIKSMIDESKKLNNPEFIKISNAVEQTINKTMKYLQKQLEYFKMWKSTFGMPTEAVNPLKFIQEKQENKFTGKQVAQIIKDLKTEKQIQKFNEVKIKRSMKEVSEKMEQTQKMIREMYSMWAGDILKQVKKLEIKQEFKIPQIPKLSLKIKQKWLENVNERLKNLKEKPTDLEIKFVSNFNDPFLNQFALSFKNLNLKLLKTLTLYYPFTLGDSNFINAEKSISSSLLNLPYLSTVTIIANDIKSLD